MPLEFELFDYGKKLMKMLKRSTRGKIYLGTKLPNSHFEKEIRMINDTRKHQFYEEKLFVKESTKKKNLIKKKKFQYQAEYQC